MPETLLTWKLNLFQTFPLCLGAQILQAVRFLFMNIYNFDFFLKFKNIIYFLFAASQEWAKKCLYAHSLNYAATVYGELLYKTPSGPIDVTVVFLFNLYNFGSLNNVELQAFNTWFSEGRFYDWHENACKHGNCHGYFQILWDKT